MGKYIIMAEEYASKLMTDFLDVFGIASSVWPIFRFSDSFLNPKQGTKYHSREFISKLSIDGFKNHISDGKFVLSSAGKKDEIIGTLKINLHTVDDEEIIDTDAFDVTLGNRKFSILIYDSPNNLGFGTCLPDYDYDTYMCVDMSELRPDGSKKYNIIFGFDLEKMKFLELFALEWKNQTGIIREPENIYKLEKLYFGKDLLQFKVEI